jgi:hypothetical protein
MGIFSAILRLYPPKPQAKEGCYEAIVVVFRGI